MLKARGHSLEANRARQIPRFQGIISREKNGFAEDSDIEEMEKKIFVKQSEPFDDERETPRDSTARETVNRRKTDEVIVRATVRPRLCCAKYGKREISRGWSVTFRVPISNAHR